MSKLQKFIPFVKMDEATHTVYGLVTAEVPDKEGEICDYDGAKAAYQAWSKEISEATEAAGQEVSYGNIRLQHTLQIGGKATAIDYDDDKKEIWLRSQPVNDDVWDLLKGGYLTGYSQGGDYASRKPEGKHVRYVPVIAEVSYVDNPCLTAAHFSLVKVDGTTEQHEFKVKGGPMAEEAAPAVAVVGAAGISTEVAALVRKALLDNGLLKRSQLTKDESKQRVEKLKAWLLPAATSSFEKGMEARGLQKSMYDVACFAQLLCELAYLMRNAEYEAAYEEDESEVPAALRSRIDDLTETFLAMAEEEAEELTATKAGKRGNMVKTLTPEALEKAHKSLAAHIQKAKDMATDHCEKVTKMHKDHAEAMNAHLDKIHKILGAEEVDGDAGKPGGSNDPEAINVAGQGTSNTAQAKATPAAAVGTGLPQTQEELAATIQKAIEAATPGIVKSTVKAMVDDDEEEEKAGEDNKDNKKGKKAVGVGERGDVMPGAGPVLKVMPVRKVDDGAGAAAPAAAAPVDMSKVLQGDRDEQLKFMKSATPQRDVPATLLEPLGAIAR